MYTFPVTMQGSSLTLKMTRHASTRINQRSMDEPEAVLVDLALLLEQEDVADYLLGEVPIGEEVIIFDEDNHRSFALVMDTHEIRICTVFYTVQNRRVRAAQDEFCVIIKNAILQCAGLFGNIQGSFASTAII